MGRPSIRVKCTITSNEFSVPRTFNSIPNASSTTGLTDRGIRAACHLKRESMQKRSGEVYNLKWEEPDPTGKAPLGGRVKYVSKPAKKCNKCSNDLTPEDRSVLFTLYPEGDYDRPLPSFPSIRHRRKPVSPFAH